MRLSHTVDDLGSIKPRSTGQRELIEYVKQNPNGSIFMFGPTGGGKTFLGRSVFKRRFMADKMPYVDRYIYISASTLLPTVYDVEETSEMIARVHVAKLVFIDDFGKIKPSEWTNSTLFAIIDDIYSGDTQVIITSNLPLSRMKLPSGEVVDGISEVYSPYIARRIEDKCSIFYLARG
jgi:DNA replication protein DnaC